MGLSGIEFFLPLSVTIHPRNSTRGKQRRTLKGVERTVNGLGIPEWKNSTTGEYLMSFSHKAQQKKVTQALFPDLQLRIRKQPRYQRLSPYRIP